VTINEFNSLKNTIGCTRRIENGLIA